MIDAVIVAAATDTPIFVRF